MSIVGAQSGKEMKCLRMHKALYVQTQASAENDAAKHIEKYARNASRRFQLEFTLQLNGFSFQPSVAAL
jgi:hypothetical protein